MNPNTPTLAFQHREWSAIPTERIGEGIDRQMVWGERLMVCRLRFDPHVKAIEFNGTSDGVFVESNPLAGLERFTIEVLLSPAADGTEEQRFVHIEEAGTGNRALIELRMLPGAMWCLDTFLRHGDASLTLIDRALTHRSASWHVAALTFDGRTMTHYVDGVRQGSGAVAFTPLGPGRTSFGVRQNLVSWFKGRIRVLRVTPAVVLPADLLKVPR